MIQEQIQKRNRKLALQKLSLTLLVCAVFAMLSVVVVRYAQISNLQMSNNKLEQTVSDQQAEVEDLSFKVKQATDLQNIATQAKERLNMGYPKAYQLLNVSAASAGGSRQTEGNKVKGIRLRLPKVRSREMRLTYQKN